MIDPRTVQLRGKRTASLAQAHTFAQHATWKHAAVYLSELSERAHDAGLDFAVLAAQSSEETARWTSDVCRRFNNPAGMKTKDGNLYITFSGPRNAARAHVVQMCAYVYGKIPADSDLAQYKPLAERFDIAVKLFGGDVATLAHLGRGLWAEDPSYAHNIAQHLEALRGTTPAAVGHPPEDVAVQIRHSPNHFGRPWKPTRQVFHVTDDLVYANTESWFLNPNSQASSNYVIRRDGTPVQFVDPAIFSPWTNGDEQGSRRDIPSLNREFDSGNNMNLYCITYETVATPNVPPTDAQYRTLERLAKQNAARFGLNTDRSHMNRHADINSVTRAYCPGRLFDLARIIRYCGGDPERLDS